MQSASSPRKQGTDLHDAVQSGSIEEVESVLVSIDAKEKDYKDAHGRTALMSACESNHMVMVMLLLKSGVNADLQSNEGLTALMLASKNGHNNIVEMLLKAHVKTELLSKDGQTAESLAKTEEVRRAFRDYAERQAIYGDLEQQHIHIMRQAEGVQARREWMQRRDALQAQYDAVESDLQYAECAQLWQDITAHEKLSDALVPSMEDYRTLADRHQQLVAAMGLKCKVLLCIKDFTSLETVSLMLADLQAIDAQTLIFPADAAVSTRPFVAGVVDTAKGAALVSKYAAKQAQLATQLEDIRTQHQAMLAQAAGIPALQDWVQRRAALTVQYEAAEKNEEYLHCAQLGKECIALDAEGTRLPLTVEDYRTLGVRHVLLVSRHNQLAAKRDQTVVDLDRERRELLAVKDFAGLDAVAQLLTCLQEMDFTALAPPPEIALPPACDTPGSSLAYSPASSCVSAGSFTPASAVSGSAPQSRVSSLQSQHVTGEAAAVSPWRTPEQAAPVDITPVREIKQSPVKPTMEAAQPPATAECNCMIM